MESREAGCVKHRLGAHKLSYLIAICFLLSKVPWCYRHDLPERATSVVPAVVAFVFAFLTSHTTLETCTVPLHTRDIHPRK